MRSRALGLLFTAALLGCTEERNAEVTAPEDALTKEWERGPLKARLRIWPEEPTIVDPLHLTLEAEVRNGYEVTLPGFGDGLGGFLISDYRTESPEKGEKTTIHRAHYDLEVFLSGEYTIQPMVFAFRKEGTGAAGDADPVEARPAEAEPAPGAAPIKEAPLPKKREDAAAPPAGDAAPLADGTTPTPAPLDQEARAPQEPTVSDNQQQPEDAAYKLKTEQVTVMVRSLEEGAAAIGDLKPPAPPEALPAGTATVVWYIASGAAGTAALGTVLFLLLRKRLRRVFVPPPIPPHEAAYRELKALLAEDLIGAGLYKEFYFRLTFIVRQYIEGRFGLRAPEQTTEEFLGAAASSGRLTAAHQTLLQEFLTYADLVKYAKYAPQAADVERSFNAARTFINETKPQAAGTGGSRVPA